MTPQKTHSQSLFDGHIQEKPKIYRKIYPKIYIYIYLYTVYIYIFIYLFRCILVYLECSIIFIW